MKLPIVSREAVQQVREEMKEKPTPYDFAEGMIDRMVEKNPNIGYAVIQLAQEVGSQENVALCAAFLYRIMEVAASEGVPERPAGPLH